MLQNVTPALAPDPGVRYLSRRRQQSRCHSGSASRAGLRDEPTDSRIEFTVEDTTDRPSTHARSCIPTSTRSRDGAAATHVGRAST